MGSMTQREKLQMITEAVKRAERGDYSVTVPVQGTQDPLDTLCREINSFLASVHRRLTECSSTEDALREKAGRYRLLAENATDIIFTMDLDLRFTFISPSVERLRGYTVEEAMAQSPGDALTPASLEKAMTAFAEEMNIERSGTGDLHRTRTLELEERCKDGSVIWTETTFSPLRDEQNNAIGFMGITRDVTQRKRAQEALDLSRAQLQAVIDASLDAITVTDGNGTFLASNKVLQERWGKSRDEIVGHSAAEVLTPGVFANRLERVRRCIATGRSDHFTDRRDDAWFENTIAPIVEPDGRIRTVAMFSRDITERKRAEDRLVSLSQQLNDIIELIPDATFVIDQDKRVIAWNRATEEMTGVRKESMLGRGDYEYAVPFFGERKPILIDLLDEPDTKIEAFYKYVHRQGDKIYAESYIPGLNGGRGAHLWGVAAPLYDRDGNRFGSIEVIRDVTANVLKEEERLRSERKYREILEQIDDGYYEVDLEGTFTFFNNAMCRILKYTPEEMLGLNNRAFMDEENARKVFATFNQVYRTAQAAKALDWELIRKDGTRCVMETSVSLMRDDRGTPIGFRGISRDVTQQKHLQQQLFQAQKMESIGRMTGGIAHDFNNMLTPILGYAELLMHHLPSDDPRRANMENIIHSAERSRDLVRQLLAFSRQQTLEMKPLDLNSSITSFEKILRRTLHENVAIRTTLAPGLGTILADVGQIEQILMNLSVNAQDAMPMGGILFIETSQVHLDEAYAAMHKGSMTGDYVLLTVSDTGTGMDQDVLDHLFEPFFTTKAPGKGTGLGLSTVYGIVKQHGGYIMAYSEPAKGTTFRIYFPLSGAPSDKAASRLEQPHGIGGCETVLVIEDEELVRELVTGILKDSGYTVLEARDGKTAHDLARTFSGQIHLVISDMILPDATGTDLFEQLGAVRSGMKVLYMSGYTPDVISHVGQLGPEAHFIQKPFTLHEFSHKVRTVLDG